MKLFKNALIVLTLKTIHEDDRSKNKRIIYKDIQELVENNKKYDVITMWHVLEHVSNLKEYIKRLNALLNTNGTLIIAVPNFNSFDAGHYKIIGQHMMYPDICGTYQKNLLHSFLQRLD